MWNKTKKDYCLKTTRINILKLEIIAKCCQFLCKTRCYYQTLMQITSSPTHHREKTHPNGKFTTPWFVGPPCPPPCCPCHPISYTHRMPNFEKRHAPQVAYKSWPKTIITKNSPNFRQSHLSEICPLWGLLFPGVQNKPTGYVLQTKRWSRAEAAPEEANIGFVAMPGVLKRGWLGNHQTKCRFQLMGKSSIKGTRFHNAGKHLTRNILQ